MALEIVTVNIDDPERVLFTPIGAALDAVATKAPPAWSYHISKLRELITYLESAGAGETYRGWIFPFPPFALTLIGRDHGTLAIGIDFYDKANVGDDAPTLHYRLQFKRQGAKLTQDVRTSDPAYVARHIQMTLGPGSPKD